MKSPCESGCLVYACCTHVCDEQIFFTAEILERIKKYCGFIDKRTEEEVMFQLMKPIWDINRRISKRNIGSTSNESKITLKYVMLCGVLRASICAEENGKNDEFLQKYFDKFLGVKGFDI